MLCVVVVVVVVVVVFGSHSPNLYLETFAIILPPSFPSRRRDTANGR